MRIVFAGPGALGSLFAARTSLLLQANSSGEVSADHSIWILDYRKERARQLNRRGLVLQEKQQKTKCLVTVTHRPDDIGSCDALFLCVKSPAVQTALAHAESLLDDKTLLISMQNGIGHLDNILNSGAVPMAAITSEGATLKEIGHVIHGGSGMTRLGLLTKRDGVEKKCIDTVVELLNKAGIKTQKTDDPFAYIWTKLFANVGINALSALHGVPNGKLLDSEVTRKIMKEAVEEAVKVALALDKPVVGDPVQNTFEICRKTSHNISSMLQDVRNKRLTEIDAINGAIVAEARQLNIATPINGQLVAAIKKLEQSYNA